MGKPGYLGVYSEVPNPALMTPSGSHDGLESSSPIASFHASYKLMLYFIIHCSLHSWFITQNTLNPLNPSLSQLGPSRLSRLLLPIAQQPPQNLAARTLRNHIYKLDPALEPFMPGLVLLHVQVNILEHISVRLSLRLRRLDNKGLGEFARPVVGDLDDGAVGDVWVDEEVGFELGRCDLVALSVLARVSLPERRRTLTLINSLMRSTMNRCSFPDGDLTKTTSSPVRIQRPSSCHTNVSALAFSLFR